MTNEKEKNAHTVSLALRFPFVWPANKILPLNFVHFFAVAHFPTASVGRLRCEAVSIRGQSGRTLHMALVAVVVVAMDLLLHSNYSDCLYMWAGC